MLINAIKFQMHGTNDEFVVENTIDNYELILTNRYTRQIQFVSLLNFDFMKKMHVPFFMIEAMVNEYLEETIALEESEPYVNEMVGTY